jgi:hypothetical protein
MKAILDNFTKISETEFHLKKDLQFATISLNDQQEIQSVQYEDKQDLQIGDILTHSNIDYEILSIDASNIKFTSVKVNALLQEQPVLEPKKFVARKMSPRVVRPVTLKKKPSEVIIDTKQSTIIEQPVQPGLHEFYISKDMNTLTPPIANIIPKEEIIVEQDNSINIIPKEEIIVDQAKSTIIIPKKQHIFKRLLGYIGNKLTNYSDR